jgi:ParB family transcriptional regulator, chromosome partitioning protein
MARKMFEKAGLIPGLQANLKPAGDATVSAEPSKAKTAPGTMMGFLTAQSGLAQEAETLKARVKLLEAETPLRKLDPAQIKPSKWANRHEASFLTAEFKALKDEIAAAGGNVQPIKVRPVQVLNGSTPSAGASFSPGFELIFGHRRHRACAELGIPVLAAVEEATDVSLFEQMERENRGRKNLSAWEQGAMYRRALDDGLYSSLRRLAEGLGVDVSQVSKSVSLARLPDAVVAAFQSPLDIQFRWAAVLTEAMQKDPDGTLSRARALALARDGLGPAAILSKLIGLPEAASGRAATQPLTISKAGKVAAKLTADTKGRAVVRFEAGALPESKRKALVKVIEDFLKS